MAKDKEMLELVSRHVASYHTNDDSVLNQFLYTISNSPLDYATPETWQLIQKIAKLQDARLGSCYHQSGIDIILATVLYKQNKDPSSVLSDLILTALKSNGYLPTLPKVLWSHSNKVMVSLIGHNLKHNVLLLTRLMKCRAENLVPLLETICKDGLHGLREYVITDFVEELVLYPGTRQILESIAPFIVYNETLISRLQKYHFTFLKQTILDNVDIIINHGFTKNYRILDFYQFSNLGLLILGKWDSVKEDLRWNEKMIKVAALYMNGFEFWIKSKQLIIDNDDLEKLALNSVILNLEHVVKLFENGEFTMQNFSAKVLSVYKMASKNVVLETCALLPGNSKVVAALLKDTLPFNEIECINKLSLKYLMFRFLDQPSEELLNSWLLKANTISANKLKLNKNQLQSLDCLYQSKLITYVWNRLKKVDDVNLKKEMLKSVPTESFPYLNLDVKLEMLKMDYKINSSREKKALTAFAFSCWICHSKEIEMNKIICEKMRDHQFTRSFIDLLFIEATKNETKGVELVKDGLVLVDNKPALRYQLQLLSIYLLNRDGFASSIAGFTQNLPFLVLPIFKDALLAVIQTLKINLLVFIHKLLEIAECKLLRVLSAFLLPENVPKSGPYVINPDIKLYGDILNRLQGENDPAIDIILQSHYNRRCFI